MNFYQVAQQAIDEVLGQGAYKRLNHFDPSKGETYASMQEPKVRKPRNKKTVDQLIDSIDPKARLPRGFGLWSTTIQVYWLKQHQRKVK